MASAAVIPIDTLAGDIPGDAACGVDLRDADGAALVLLDTLKRSDQETPANWPQFVDKASGILAERSKDIEVASWLTEGLAWRYGVPGFRDGLALVAALLEKYRDRLFPAAADVRAGKLGYLDTLDGVFWQLGLTAPKDGRRCSYFDWAREQGRAEFESAMQATPSADCRNTYHDLLECQAAIETIGRLGEAQFGDDAPSLSNLESAVEQCLRVVGDALRARGETLPTLAGQPQTTEPAPSGGTSEAASALTTGASGGGLPLQPRSRADAVGRLVAIAEYFRRNEPSSPVPFAVERAIKWAEMPIDEWLQSVIREEGVLNSLLRDILDAKKQQQPS